MARLPSNRAQPASRIAGLPRWLGGRDLRAPLPFDWRASCPAPPFSFGVPFPWQGMDVARLDFGPDDPPLLCLAAPRADGRQASLVFWCEENGPIVARADVRPLVRDLARSRQARHV